jgi:hypothetical protein
MHSISLRYGGTHLPEARAFTSWYNDPGISKSGFSDGGVKSVVENVVRDMGLRGCEVGDKLEVLDALLGDDGKQLLESHPDEEGQTLRKVIEDELEKEESFVW